MTIFLITLGTMLFVVLAMSVGVLITGRRLKGSCGGLSSGSCACKEKGILPGKACGAQASPNEVVSLRYFADRSD